jgi:hypothetical protein
MAFGIRLFLLGYLYIDVIIGEKYDTDKKEQWV